jgi:guanyl-specific ribonuclease Sa
MEDEGQTAAVPFPLLEKQPVLNAQAFGRPIVVFSPPGEHAALAYERTIDGKPLHFEQVPGEARLTVRDVETGSIWSWEDGACVQGPFEGRLLKRLTGITVYWGIWAQFHPKTAIVEGGS